MKSLAVDILVVSLFLERLRARVKVRASQRADHDEFVRSQYGRLVTEQR